MVGWANRHRLGELSLDNASALIEGHPTESETTAPVDAHIGHCQTTRRSCKTLAVLPFGMANPRFRSV
jgi:hypothetical protein